MIEENNSPLKQKGGFAKSSGSRGKGGRNVGGYNVNTSFAVKPAWKKPRSGGFIGAVASPKPTKPYTIDDKGKVEEPSSKTEYGKEEGKLPTYREAWDSNNEGVKDRKGKDGKAKYKSFEEFEADAMNYKKETPAKAKQEVSAVPFKLKGSPMYRNFGVGGKPKNNN